MEAGLLSFVPNDEYRRLPDEQSPVVWFRGERIGIYERSLARGDWGDLAYRGPKLTEEDDAFLVSEIAERRVKIVDGEGQWKRALILSSIEIELKTTWRKIEFVQFTPFEVPAAELMGEMRFIVNPYFKACCEKADTIKIIDFFNGWNQVKAWKYRKNFLTL